jgi:multicomponent Na+:H+ antiporter subunit G
MTVLVTSLSALLLAGGALFFLAGTVGLLRFPDALSRLHALSKADNVGLGLIVLGLLPLASGWGGAAKLVLLWLIVQGSGAAVGQLLARALHERAIE